MTVPIIDGIDHETFEYRPVYQGEQHFRGIFEWGMLYKVSRGFYFSMVYLLKNPKKREKIDAQTLYIRIN